MSEVPNIRYKKLLESDEPLDSKLQVFLDWLKANYPIPDDVKLTLTLDHKKGRKTVNGDTMGINYTHQTNRTSDIVIYQALKKELPELLDTVAHEYKHTLQAFVEMTDTYFTKGNRTNIRREVFACMFAMNETWQFCYGWR